MSLAIAKAFQKQAREAQGLPPSREEMGWPELGNGLRMWQPPPIPLSDTPGHYKHERPIPTHLVSISDLPVNAGSRIAIILRNGKPILRSTFVNQLTNEEIGGLSKDFVDGIIPQDIWWNDTNRHLHVAPAATDYAPTVEEFDKFMQLVEEGPEEGLVMFANIVYGESPLHARQIAHTMLIPNKPVANTSYAAYNEWHKENWEKIFYYCFHWAFWVNATICDAPVTYEILAKVGKSDYMFQKFFPSAGTIMLSW